MVRICSPIVQDPVPLNVAHQTRQCGFSSSTNSFVSRKQLTGFLYLCAIHIPQFTMPCHAMPCHAIWRSCLFSILWDYWWRNSGNTYAHVLPRLGVAWMLTRCNTWVNWTLLPTTARRAFGARCTLNCVCKESGSPLLAELVQQDSLLQVFCSQCETAPCHDTALTANTGITPANPDDSTWFFIDKTWTISALMEALETFSPLLH